MTKLFVCAQLLWCLVAQATLAGEDNISTAYGLWLKGKTTGAIEILYPFAKAGDVRARLAVASYLVRLSHEPIYKTISTISMTDVHEMENDAMVWLREIAYSSKVSDASEAIELVREIYETGGLGLKESGEKLGSCTLEIRRCLQKKLENESIECISLIKPVLEKKHC